jgi:Right handed beta helix region
MLLHKLTTKFSFLLVLAVFFTASSRASTITVVPSEAQNQIQAAINNSHSGDTISFQAGTFNITNLRLVAGRTYVGATNGQTIIHGGGGNSLFIFYGTGLTVQHFTFDGGGIYLGGPVSNVHVEYNTFQNISFGPNPYIEFGNWTATIGIFIDTSASSSDFSYNTFRNMSSQILSQYVDWNLGVTGIFGYNLVNSTINYNTFDTVNEGIHLFDGKNLQVLHNTITHFHRIAMEFQNTFSNLEIGYNTYSAPLSPFWATFGISAAIMSSNANIHDNLIDDQVKQTCGNGCWTGYGIEAWGVGTLVTNNTIQGHWGDGVAIGPSSNLHVVNNKICGQEMSSNGNGYVVNQQNTRWSGELISGNTTSSALVCK